MANLIWTDYLFAVGIALFFLSFIIITHKMHTELDRRWRVAAEWLPFLSHLWYIIRHWEKALGWIAVGMIGVLFVIAGFHWKPPRP
jgi:hypothetical protein